MAEHNYAQIDCLDSLRLLLTELAAPEHALRRTHVSGLGWRRRRMRWASLISPRPTGILSGSVG